MIPTKGDRETERLLIDNEKGRLDTVRHRAQSWLGAISIITSLFGFALVISGPSTVSEISFGAKIAVGVLMLMGFVCLLLAIYWAFQSAYGSQLDRNLRFGLEEEYLDHRSHIADAAQKYAHRAITLFAFGVVLVVVVLGVSWFVPRGELTCLFVGDETNRTVVAVIQGGQVVSTKDPVVDVGPCP